jgi:hypothetical protein
MSLFTETFNNREISVFAWLLIFFAWAIMQRNIRSALYNLIKIFLLRRILVSILLMLVYILSAIVILYKIDFWNNTLIKDTVLWIIGGAFIMLMNANKANKDKTHLKKLFIDNIKFVVIFQFIINLYTFGLVIELLLIPFLTFITMLSAYAKHKEEHKQVKVVFDVIATVVTLYAFSYSLYQISVNFQEFASDKNLRTFMLPIILGIFYLPFIYFTALYMAYEELFTRVDFRMRDNKDLVNFTKKRIAYTCLFSLTKINSFSKKIKIYNFKNESEILAEIEKAKVLA